MRRISGPPPWPDGEDIQNDTILAPDVKPNSFKDDVAALYGISLEKSEGHFEDAYETAKGFPLDERMGGWYGFVSGAKIGRWDVVNIPERLKDDKRIKCVLRDSIVEVDGGQLVPIRQFVASLVAKVKVPTSLSDMHGSDISNFGNPTIRGSTFSLHGPGV